MVCEIADWLRCSRRAAWENRPSSTTVTNVLSSRRFTAGPRSATEGGGGQDRETSSDRTWSTRLGRRHRPLADRCRRRARNLSGGRTAARPDVPPLAPAVTHYGSYNPLCMDVSIPAEAPKRVHDHRGSALPAGCPDRRQRRLGRHDRIWQDIAPFGHYCHCWVCATRRIFSAMADTLTLLLLVSMILAPVGLLAALATRHGRPAPVERAPQPIPLHNRYRGQPIR